MKTLDYEVELRVNHLIDVKLEVILARNEALRTVNAELSAQNKVLRTENRSLRARLRGTVLGRPQEKEKE